MRRRMRKRRPGQLRQPRAAADAKAAAQARADAEAKKKAEEEAKALATLITAPVAARSVSYSTDYLATDAIKANATALGNYKLTFYCPCERCNGALGVSKTGLRRDPAEGRTIAVDSSIIPLGSRVYIEGYGILHRGGHRQRDQEQQDRYLRIHARACRRAGRPVRKRLPSRLRENRRDREKKRSLFVCPDFHLQRRRKFAIIERQGW